MNKRRVFSFFLALCLAFSVLSVQSFAAEEGAKTRQIDLSNAIWYAPGAESSEGEVYEDSTGALFFRDDAALQRIPAGSLLTGDEKILYDALIPFVRQISQGSYLYTIASIGKDYEESPVDVPAVFNGSDFTEAQFRRLIDALLADCPYEMFWYDKVTGSALIPITEDGKLTQVILLFTVAANYRGWDEFSIDGVKVRNAKASAEKAKQIRNKYEYFSDYEKLLGYKNEICSLVEYDFDAAYNYTFTTDIDPWQLISVFDENPSTNVVCEGYAKAFMYLCENSFFSSDISCYTVMGDMEGILHMWNIVDIEGKRYMVDITNSDSGTVGDDGSLFLAGGSGNAASGYSVAGISYIYDDATKNLWGTGDSSILKIEPAGYDASSQSPRGWSYESGVLTLHSWYEVPNFHEDDVQPWYVHTGDITSLVVEEGVKALGDLTISNCSTLKSVSLPDGLKTIGRKAFYGCTSLEEIELPASVTVLGQEAFSGCTALKEVTLNNGLKEIKGRTFENCTALESITVPASVTDIYPNAFNSCTALKEVVLSEGLKNIGSNAFENCSALEEISFPETLTAIKAYAFKNCSSLKEIIVPDSVTSIEDNVFDSCSSLEKAVLPNGLKILPGMIFANCESLKDVRLPDGLTTVGGYAFKNCTSLKEVAIPESATIIRGGAFSVCTSLEKIVIPEGVSSLDGETFKDCSSLKEIYLPETLKKISRYGFSGCSSLTDIVIPAAVERIEHYAFFGCTGLQSAHYLGEKSQLKIDGQKNDELINRLHYCSDGHMAPSCEEPGMEGGIYCEECGRVFKEGTPAPATGHKYEHKYDVDCDNCGKIRVVDFTRDMVNMYRMYDPNSGEHFYTGSDEEKDNLVAAGWDYEGIGFTFPLTTGKPVYRLYEPVTGEHLYTMDEEEKEILLAKGWNYEGVAFNSGFEAEVPQYRLHNPNATRGAYHFTASDVERDFLISAGWVYQGIGWYSCGK